MSILLEQHKVAYERSEEKDRMYGPYQRNMKQAGKLLAGLMDEEYDEAKHPDMVYMSIIALKLSREAYHHKEDNLFDAVGYIAQWNDYREQLNNSKDDKS